jgi:hypothetical protein
VTYLTSKRCETIFNELVIKERAMPPQGLVNDEDEQEKLPGDYSTPFSAPSGTDDTTDDIHPQADTNVDSMEHYDEGISGADEVSDPGNRGVLGYSPAQDQDDDDKDEDKEEE